MAAVGLVVLMIAVFGVFVAHGGDLTPVIKAAPWEFAQIFGAALAAAMMATAKPVSVQVSAPSAKYSKDPNTTRKITCR